MSPRRFAEETAHAAVRHFGPYLGGGQVGLAASALHGVTSSDVLRLPELLEVEPVRLRERW